MARLFCFFLDSENPQLEKTVFEYAGHSGVYECVRGKTGGAYKGQGSFQWTPAVSALCVLLLRAAAEADSAEPNALVLEGLESGAVTALDYAVSRNASWICEMFGSDVQGLPIARRLLLRSNSERKRPGPVSISINTSFLLAERISIWLNGDEIKDRSTLRSVAQKIAEQNGITLPTPRSTPRPRKNVAYISSVARDIPNVLVSPEELFSKEMKARFVEELRLSLSLTPAFSRLDLVAELKRLGEQPMLRTVQQSLSRAFSDLDFKLRSGERLGLRLSDDEAERHFASAFPLRFGVTPSQIGTVAILLYLRDIRKLPIIIDFSFAHTSEVANVMQTNPRVTPECCVITTASALLLSAKTSRDYRPLMVMPAATHTVLGPTAPRESGSASMKGDYLLLCDFPTTPNFWFEELKAQGAIPQKKTDPHHFEPDECLRALRDRNQDLYAILWFPYNVFNEQFAGCSPLLSSWNGSGISAIQNVLYVHSSLSRQRRRFLDIVIRDAWLRLIESDALRCDIVDRLEQDSEYLRVLWRCSGIPAAISHPVRQAVGDGIQHADLPRSAQDDQKVIALRSSSRK